jgi:hypothetical protein
MFKKISHPVALLSVALFASAAVAAVSVGLSTTGVSQNVSYTQLPINTPSGVVANDVLIATLAVNGGSQTTVTPPNGWNLIARTDNDANVSLITYWKAATANEPSSYSWNVSPQTRAAGGITRYSGLNNTNPIDVIASSTGRGQVATAPTITTSNPNEQILAVFATDTGTNNSPLFTTSVGMTKLYDRKYAPLGPTLSSQDASQSTVGIVTARDSNISTNASRDWAAQQIALRAINTTTTVVENFETYTAGSILSGQNGGIGWTGPWTGSADYIVGSTNAPEGAKTGQVDGLASIHDALLQRSFTAKTAGTLHWLQRKDAPDDGQSVSMYSGTTLAFYVGIGSVNQPQAGGPDWTGNDGNLFFIIQPYNVGIWDTVDAEFDTTTNSYRVSLNGAPYSAWKPFSNTVASVDTLHLQLGGSGNNLGTNYWDDIQIRN